LNQGLKDAISLPFPTMTEEKKKNLIFRIVFKPETGQLWGFNGFHLDQELLYNPSFSELMKG
jgi:hypothetical protein